MLGSGAGCWVGMRDCFEKNSFQSDVGLRWPKTPKMPSLERCVVPRRCLWSCGPSGTLTTGPIWTSGSSETRSCAESFWHYKFIQQILRASQSKCSPHHRHRKKSKMAPALGDLTVEEEGRCQHEFWARRVQALGVWMEAGWGPWGERSRSSWKQLNVMYPWDREACAWNFGNKLIKWLG